MNYFCHHKCYETIPEESQMCHHFATIEAASEENDMRGYTCGCYEPYEICIDQFSCVPKDGSVGYENGRFVFQGDTSNSCGNGQIGIEGTCYSVSDGVASYGGALEACGSQGGALVNVQSRKVWWVLGNSIN